jgi:RNA polymerase sigma factor (TIGR02999 family)
LTPTTLLHEAYLELAERRDLAFPDRARFLGYAARAMRGLVIDFVRRSRAQKRGGGAFEITLDAEVAPTREAARQSEELTRLSDAVDELGRLEPALAELVDLHFFCGYTFAEIAGMRGVSERTVQRDWQKPRRSSPQRFCYHPQRTVRGPLISPCVNILTLPRQVSR